MALLVARQRALGHWGVGDGCCGTCPLPVPFAFHCHKVRVSSILSLTMMLFLAETQQELCGPNLWSCEAGKTLPLPTCCLRHVAVRESQHAAVPSVLSSTCCLCPSAHHSRLPVSKSVTEILFQMKCYYHKIFLSHVCVCVCVCMHARTRCDMHAGA